MNKKILFLSLACSLFLPSLSSAQTIEGMVTSVVNNVVWPVAIAAVVIFWLATGILFLAAMGDPSKLNTAKMSLIASIIGTIVVVIAASAMAIIRNSLGI